MLYRRHAAGVDVSGRTPLIPILPTTFPLPRSFSVPCRIPTTSLQEMHITKLAMLFTYTFRTGHDLASVSPPQVGVYSLLPHPSFAQIDCMHMAGDQFGIELGI